MLFVVTPLVLLVLLTGGVVVGLSVFRGAPISETAEAVAEQSVSVGIPSAELNFSPSPDGLVHASMTGTFAGSRPTLSVTSANGITTVSGGCPDGWLFSRCNVTVSVQLPAELPLTVQGTNGSISLIGLDGDIDVATSNGRIKAAATSGDLSLRTVNGAIQVMNTTSSRLTANATNGSIELEFNDAPSAVTATTTNGQITVRVPDDASRYFIDAQTVNGQINTDGVSSDRTAERTITAKTINGAVTVERSGQ